MSKKVNDSRRDFLKTGVVAGVGVTSPLIFSRTAMGAAYRNEPTGATVTFGFNVPQTGAYADEGAER